MKKRNRTTIVARCAVCAKIKITESYQRGVTNIESVRVCAECANKTYKRSARNPRHRNQMDLFAK